MGQLRMSKKIQENPQTVIEKAIDYFGEKGLGLHLFRHTDNGAYFTNGGGHIQVTAIPAASGEETEVDVQTREWEYDVKKFMEEL